MYCKAKKKFRSNPKIFENFHFWKFTPKKSLKGGISIYADFGPPRYVLWCCGGICHELLIFFQIGCGHTVSYFTLFFQKLKRFPRVSSKNRNDFIELFIPFSFFAGFGRQSYKNVYLHFLKVFPVLPWKQKPSKRKSRNLSYQKQKTNLPKFVMSRAYEDIVSTKIAM